MTLRRIRWIFVAIALGSFALAGAGQWLLHWPWPAVVTWLSIASGYLLAALLLALMPRWWRQHCDEMFATAASRRYQRAIWPAMIAYALLLSASLWWIRNGIEPLALRALVALLPVVPLLFFLRALLRYLREIDELQRRIETEAIGIASLLVSMLYFAGGLLEKAKVVGFDAGAAMIWVFPLLCASYGIARMLLTRRYL